MSNAYRLCDEHCDADVTPQKKFCTICRYEAELAALREVLDEKQQALEAAESERNYAQSLVDDLKDGKAKLVVRSVDKLEPPDWEDEANE